MQTIRYPHNSWRGLTQPLLVAALTALFVTAASAQSNVVDVTKMSVEDLMNMQVTSVSKRTQKVADAAAAVYVITQEDIRRSGAWNPGSKD
jgi:iron complex outermembrane receptor protein